MAALSATILMVIISCDDEIGIVCVSEGLASGIGVMLDRAAEHSG
ncbi:Uncharacterized protein ChrSV_3554 [Chromobacterium vaccinii]|nr:Uncharacterized protein ChrSW_3554 [Chromobacterium vaccinii]QND91011.1 Uncharacterized protein ChrSV_3554 [Chromobacterium vaccinii]